VLLSVLYLLVRTLARILGRRDDQGRELEIVVLRHQLRVVSRRVSRPRFSIWDRVFLAAASRALPRARWNSFLIRPATLLKWHRELVARKWRLYGARGRPGRPALPRQVRDLVVRLAKENPRWGYMRIHGELRKLGVTVSATTVRNILRRHGLGPAPRRGDVTWSEFLRHQAGSVLACDFFVVETLFVTRIYVLFFIELSSRRVLFAACTGNPDGPWVTQQARNVLMCVEDRCSRSRLLIHDRDAKFTAAFDEVFRADGIEVIRTPIRAPRANAFAERWVRTIRAECLDWLLIVSRRHLQGVLTIYIDHYNRSRPHRGIGLGVPDAPSAQRRSHPGGNCPMKIRTRHRLGGLLHEYESAA
jgi:putative transposase